MTDFSSDSRIKPSVKRLHTEDPACVEIIARRNDRQTSSPSDRSSNSRRDPEIALDTARQGLSQYFHGHRQPLVFSKDVPLSYHHYSDINGKLV